MSVKTSETFSCDWPEGCKKNTHKKGDVAWFSLSYRATDSSSGVTDNHYCEAHESQVIEAARSVGLFPPAEEPA